MPANLTPEYRKAEQEYRAARTPDEKLACLQHMLSVIPKHKGTDRLQGDIKRRIARLKDTVQAQTKKRGPSYRIKPEGAGQVMLVGQPNSGKSSLVTALTHARPEIAAYPCTTREPVPGMLDYEAVHIQLVDLPPVWREHCESFVFDNIRACDAVLVVVALDSSDPVADLDETLAFLEEKHIALVPALDEPPDPESEDGGIEHLLVLNKADLDPDGKKASTTRQKLGGAPHARVVSAETTAGLDELAADIFAMLHVIRIYTKEPGKPPDLDTPYTVPIGCTTIEFAASVHKDFAEHFKSARVWGSAKFDGQVVQRDHVLQDRDVVELSMSGALRALG